MARSLELTRDQMLAQRAAGTPIPDGSGRIVRNGVIVSAGDVMRSQAERVRNQALEMQTAGYRAPLESMSRELARVPEFSMPMAQPQIGFTSPATSSVQPSPMRTQTGEAIPEAVGPGELQRSLAILRDERTRIGPGVKDYSDRRLDEIARAPGGAQQIITEANQIVPMLRESQQREESIGYVTNLSAQAEATAKEMDSLNSQIGAAPVPTDQQKASALAFVIQGNPELGEAEQDAIAQTFAAEEAQGAWKAANRDRLARLEQLRREQATASAQVQEFAKRGVFPRQAATAPAAVPGTAGSSTAALDAPAPQEPGLSWLPQGSVAYQTPRGFVVNGDLYASEADAQATLTSAAENQRSLETRASNYLREYNSRPALAALIQSNRELIQAGPQPAAPAAVAAPVAAAPVLGPGTDYLPDGGRIVARHRDGSPKIVLPASLTRFLDTAAVGAARAGESAPTPAPVAVPRVESDYTPDGGRILARWPDGSPRSVLPPVITRFLDQATAGAARR